MLELAKAVSFLICILSLYWAGFSAFFVPGSRWEERMWVAGFKLLAAAAICFYSGMVFSWPSKANPTAFQRLTATMPVRLFFWALAGIAVVSPSGTRARPAISWMIFRISPLPSLGNLPATP